jgi:hypothetical protein
MRSTDRPRHDLGDSVTGDWNCDDDDEGQVCWACDQPEESCECPDGFDPKVIIDDDSDDSFYIGEPSDD